MKTLVKLLPLLVLAGCMMPNINRLIPENKDFHGMIYSPIYGWAVLDTRVMGSTNALPPLPIPAQIPTAPPVASPQAGIMWPPPPPVTPLNVPPALEGSAGGTTAQ